ncbi:hypothetical protein M9Y10_014531 [Tritrichomonas musculus]|uniref:Ubiquitin-like domain-containing protein n=1 Tax=Tritrichomonas musculus TaxID=1915356 RepID=A0ABR2KZS5_9EUKA
MEVEGHNEAINSDESNIAFISEGMSRKIIDPEQKIMHNNMKIYVYQPFMRIRHIKLNMLSPISILSRIYPPNSIYIFNGQILDVSKSFSFYNIKNENKIVLITSLMKKSDPKLVDKWIKNTTDQDSFEERVDLNINKNCRRELARIKDIKFYKLEIKRKTFGKFLKNQNTDLMNSNSFNANRNKFQEEIDLKIDYNQLKEPSFDPLPVLW